VGLLRAYICAALAVTLAVALPVYRGAMQHEKS